MTAFAVDAPPLPVYEAQQGVSPTNLSDPLSGNALVRDIPLLSREELLDKLGHSDPKRSRDFLQAPFEVRTQALTAMDQVFLAMPEHATAALKILQTIRMSYQWRDFNQPKVWEHIHRLSEQKWVRSLGRTAPVGGGAIGITLSGITGRGKTSFLDRLVSLLPQKPILHDKVTGRPARVVQIVCIRVQCSHKASVKSFALSIISAIDEAIGTNYYAAADRMTEPNLLRFVMSLCSMYFVGILIVDDVQQLRQVQQNAGPVLATFCNFMETTGIPVLICGTLRMKHLLTVFPAEGSKLAARGNITFSSLPVGSLDWTQLATALWNRSILQDPVPMPEAFPKWLHRETLGVPRIARLSVQALHWRMAELEEEGELAELLNSADAVKGMLEDISKSELLPYQSALNALRVTQPGGKLSNEQASQYEDYIEPRDDLNAFDSAHPKKPKGEAAGLSQPAATDGDTSERGASPAPAEGSARPKRRRASSAGDSARIRDLAATIAEAADPYAELMKRGFLAPPLLELR